MRYHYLIWFFYLKLSVIFSHNFIQYVYLLNVFVILFCFSKNVNTMNLEGNTALHLTAINDKPECTKLLVRYGANLQACKLFSYGVIT